ncbi:hypothetical protein GCM10027614_31080 [Micromonospora vulcania]
MTLPLIHLEGKIVQSRFRRARRAGSIIGALAMIATGLVGLSPAPAQASTINGPISRNEILLRAQDWVDRGITYTQEQNVAASDEEGSHTYRRDCSGLVSMAWHLNKKSTGWDYNTEDFQGSNPMWFTLGSRDDWQPGDAMVREGHMELFAFWADRNDHSKGAYVYSFNERGETVQNPYKRSNFDNLGFNNAGDLSSFQPIRRTGLIAPVDSGEAAGHEAVGRVERGRADAGVPDPRFRRGAQHLAVRPEQRLRRLGQPRRHRPEIPDGGDEGGRPDRTVRHRR